ncbi:MAG: tRNA-specific adenosine deaminase [Candidatus Eremiobacteraeota bacterium]|nr:tRNA-specific adenosine deaminase [Candidatus Eremiobacteraeota bacterium]
MNADNRADEAYVRRAMALADQAAANGDVPIGAVLACDGATFEAFNEKERLPDPTAHAELLVLRQAAVALGRWRLSDATLYVTKEPCVMCAGAMIAARIKRLVFGCNDPKGGAAGSIADVFALEEVNHRVDVTSGVLADETGAQLQAFFSKRRQSG